jgi:hypothetical protein
MGALIAGWAFWILLAYGWATAELTNKRIAVFVALWLLGWFGFSLMPYSGRPLFTMFVAMLDIVLVLTIFKGDVHIR